MLKHNRANQNQLSPIPTWYSNHTRKRILSKGFVMIALAECTHENFKKSGKNRNGSQRYKCKDCGKRFSDEHVADGPLGTMRVDVDKAMMVINALLEGMSIRACERLFSMNRDTIDKLILVVGEKCQNFMDHNIQNVYCSDIQIDEIWSFVGMKQKQAKKQDLSLIQI